MEYHTWRNICQTLWYLLKWCSLKGRLWRPASYYTKQYMIMVNWFVTIMRILYWILLHTVWSSRTTPSRDMGPKSLQKKYNPNETLTDSTQISWKLYWTTSVMVQKSPSLKITTRRIREQRDNNLQQLGGSFLSSGRTELSHGSNWSISRNLTLWTWANMPHPGEFKTNYRWVDNKSSLSRTHVSRSTETHLGALFQYWSVENIKNVMLFFWHGVTVLFVLTLSTFHSGI